jgi:hypothetical protein
MRSLSGLRQKVQLLHIIHRVKQGAKLATS